MFAQCLVRRRAAYVVRAVKLENANASAAFVIALVRRKVFRAGEHAGWILLVAVDAEVEFAVFVRRGLNAHQCEAGLEVVALDELEIGGVFIDVVLLVSGGKSADHVEAIAFPGDAASAVGHVGKGDRLDGLECLGIVGRHQAHGARLGVEASAVHGNVHHAVLEAEVALVGRRLARDENVAREVGLHHGNGEAPVDVRAVSGHALEVSAIAAGAGDLLRQLRHGGVCREEG